MKLQYLGTAAAEGIPAVFCACKTCKRAWELGGRNIRKRSQALVNDRLLIDLPGDTLANSYACRIDLSDIHHCLITHDHMDHWYEKDLCFYLRPGFCYPPADAGGLRIYGSEDLERLFERVRSSGAQQVEHVTATPFIPMEIDGLTVTPLKAKHSTANPLIYLIQEEGKSLLYAHDTDIFPEETWEWLAEHRPRLDLVSLDCTAGDMKDNGYVGHMCLGRDQKCRERLMAIGVADETTRFVVNHFSHNGNHACYDDMVPAAEAMGFTVSYDGLVIEF